MIGLGLIELLILAIAALLWIFFWRGRRSGRIDARGEPQQALSGPSPYLSLALLAAGAVLVTLFGLAVADVVSIPAFWAVSVAVAVAALILILMWRGKARTNTAGPPTPAENFAAGLPDKGPVAPATCDQFLAALIASGVVTAKEVEAFLPSLSHTVRTSDAQTLAQHLVGAGRLTRYQAVVILQGQGQRLVLGDYVILDQLGAGGMGQVFKARHRRMDRIVAIKIISPELIKSEGAVRRFEREVRAAARLTHPNIVIAYDAAKTPACTTW